MQRADKVSQISAAQGYVIDHRKTRLFGFSCQDVVHYLAMLNQRLRSPPRKVETSLLVAGATQSQEANLCRSPFIARASVNRLMKGLIGHNIRWGVASSSGFLTRLFDQVMGAERLTLVGEVGWTHVGGLENTSKARYGRDSAYGPGPLAGSLNNEPTCIALNEATLGSGSHAQLSRNCENDGFVTADSWGYRVRAIWDYNDVFAGVNLKPNVAWSHDVDGYSPTPGGNFEEGRKAVSLGIDAEYLNTYTASLAYTNFFDGKYSTTDDRDFVALSFGVNF